MRTLYFCPVVSSFSSFIFLLFSSPNLSRRRLDVYHISTHDVALVRIYNACLKCDARGSLKIQDARTNRQKSPFGHPSIAFSFIGSVTARHSSSGRQPNFVAWYNNGITELSQMAPPIFGWAAITLASAHIPVNYILNCITLVSDLCTPHCAVLTQDLLGYSQMRPFVPGFLYTGP